MRTIVSGPPPPPPQLKKGRRGKGKGLEKEREKGKQEESKAGKIVGRGMERGFNTTTGGEGRWLRAA